MVNCPDSFMIAGRTDAFDFSCAKYSPTMPTSGSRPDGAAPAGGDAVAVDVLMAGLAVAPPSILVCELVD